MENIVITEQGKQLMSKVISETESMTFTKIAVSDYDYSGIELQNISELQSVKQTAIIAKISRTDGKTVEILAAINNEQIPEAYYVRTLGVYVKDSSENEILYGISISRENPDYMPAYDGKTLSGVSYRINVTVEDSEYITVNVNPAAVPTIMQVEDIETAFREHTEDKVSHITAADKKKLDGIEDGANKTIVDNELNSYSSNPVQNQVVYEEMLKRMAQKWVRSHLYTLYGIEEPSSVNGANTGSHYLDVKTGNTYIMTRYTDRGAQAWTNTGTLQSVEEILNSKFDKSNIANNLVTTREGYALDARQLNKSVAGSFAESVDNSITALNNALTPFKFTNVASGTQNIMAFYNSITKMMFVSFNYNIARVNEPTSLVILNDNAHTIDTDKYRFPVSAWDGTTGNIVLSYGYVSGQNICIYAPPCNEFNAYAAFFYHCK
ncbi:hypothetical protein DW721_07110 [Clostridium sp. AM27-31LB]|uniref:hypothetical protein n=1 Tax=Clostridium sp. AM27-31LB TaxID=2293026 RepID=UPI000E525C28|nr:hypothetical protein [Clostridium sp. AM27-31LB]RHT94205.1 hypothetical protein DW721_07110 [Clostridium sp. AM27-31LB]